MCERRIRAQSFHSFLFAIHLMLRHLVLNLNHAFIALQEQEIWAEPDSYILKLE